MPGISICTVLSQLPGRIGLCAVTPDTARPHRTSAIRIDFMAAPFGNPLNDAAMVRRRSLPVNGVLVPFNLCLLTSYFLLLTSHFSPLTYYRAFTRWPARARATSPG